MIISSAEAIDILRKRAREIARGPRSEGHEETFGINGRRIRVNTATDIPIHIDPRETEKYYAKRGTDYYAHLSKNGNIIYRYDWSRMWGEESYASLPSDDDVMEVLARDFLLETPTPWWKKRLGIALFGDDRFHERLYRVAGYAGAAIPEV